MESSTSPNTDDFYSYYTSAPTSPRKYNHNGFFFLSMPTSPTKDPVVFKSGLITPETPENFYPYVDNFEFEGSKRFYPYENGFDKSQDLSIAYADELFCDGKMLPLRTPPRARSMRPHTRRGNVSTASSPGARNMKLKVPFLRQRSLWNDGYDPFLAALNKIKDDKDMVGQHGKKAHLQRSKSLSPFRRPNSSAKRNTHNHNKVGLVPERDVFGPLNPNVFGPIKEGVGNSESRKQRIKKFLVKNATFGKEVLVNEERITQKTPLLLRKMHNSQRFSSKNSNAFVRFSREMKSLMKHRARIFFCLTKSFGIKSSAKIS
ncbi:hypothetical protein BVRB_4g073900 [Beta vulgaris subsp. vulgaris]|nr:hypothetical protein BVRB_4g073900 [Beta vulgaris subsp. vulgaris]